MRISIVGILIATAVIVANAAAAPGVPDTGGNGFAADQSHVKLTGFGISLTAPPGWARGLESHFGQLCRFYQLKDRKLVGLLEIQAVPAKGSTAEKAAKSVAADLGGGTVIPNAANTKSQIVELQLTATKEFPTRVAAVMPVRDQLVIFALAEAGTTTTLADLQAVVASAVVSKPSPAADDLGLNKRPIPLFDSAVMVRLPEPFRPDEVENPAQRSLYGAYDWPAARLEAGVDIHAVPNPKELTLDDFANDIARVVVKTVKLADPITFDVVNHKPPVYLSKPFAGGPHETERLMITILDDARFATVIFSATNPDAAVRDRYMAMAKDVAQATRISLEYQEARRSATPPGVTDLTSTSSAPPTATQAVYGAEDPESRLVQARHSLATKLIHPPPPSGPRLPPGPMRDGSYRLTRYDAPLGKNWAYLTPDPHDGKRHPAVMWIHGGYGGIGAFDSKLEPAENDQTPKAFKEAGFVVMYPSLRGQNDNPGTVETFYGEVDDTMCALDALSRVPYVDPSRIYMVGHSVGGTITLLAAESTSKLRAAFAFCGHAEVYSMLREPEHHHAPYDWDNPRESDIRSAINFVSGLKTPTWFIDGDEEALYPAALNMDRAAKAVHAPFQTFILKGSADHFNVLRPITRLLAAKLLADTGPTCNVSLTATELADAFNAEFHPPVPVTCLTAASPAIEIGQALHDWIIGGIAANHLDPKVAYIHLFKNKKRELVLAFQIEPHTGYLTVCNGVRVLIDDEIAASIGPTTIDMEVVPSERRYFFLMIPQGKPRSEGKQVKEYVSNE